MPKVYDDERTDAPLVDQDDAALKDSGDNEGKTAPNTLRDKEEKPLDSVGAKPLDEEEQAKLNDIESNFDEKSDEDSEFSYQDGEDGEKPKKFSLRRKINRKNGTIGSIIFVVGVGGFIINSIISGPLQLVQFGSLISLENFSNISEFNNDRSARRMYHLIKGQAQYSRLGIINNKIATKFEVKINNKSGLKSNYSPSGKFLGFEVIDESKAAGIIDDLAGDKMKVVEREGKKFIDFGDVNFKERRAAIRAFVKGADIDGIAGKLSSRLLIKRAGVDFHPLKNTKKRAAEKLITYLQKMNKERNERNQKGTEDLKIDAPEGDPGTDTNGDGTIDQPPNPEGQEAADAAKKQLSETTGVQLESEEAVTALRTKLLTALKGAAAVVGATCTLRGLGNNAETLQYTQTILPMMRTGMMYVSVASQIQSGQGVNLDELGSLQAGLYDESNDNDPATHPSSVFSAQPFQAMRGETLSGPDIDPSLKPSKIGEKPLFFSLIDKIPGIDAACSINDTIGRLPIIKQFGDITSAAVAKVIPINQLVNGLITWLAGKGMDYAAKGSPLGFISMYGGRLAANNQANASGGLELTGTESAELKSYNSDSVNYESQHRSTFAKLFDIHDYRSAASQLAINSPRTPGGALTAIISSPFKLFSLLTPHASAATSYNYGFNEVGFSVDEMNDPSITDPYAVAEEIEPQLEELNKKYGDCFNIKVETFGSDSIKVTSGDESFNPNTDDNKAKIKACNDSTDPVLLKYRAYLADAVGTQAESCWEGVDETACDEIGFGDIIAPETPVTPAVQTPAETWAFCGVDPEDPTAQKAATVLSKSAGISATMGPCMNPPATYTAGNPGSRYIAPEEYMKLVNINSSANMKTIVYDARLWSSDATVRKTAYDYWKPAYAKIAAWDMGDEFDPSGPEWSTLVARWSIMQTNTLPETGIKPFTNHLPFENVFVSAIRDLPNPERFSFDSYDRTTAVSLATSLNNRVSNLMCAVNALQHGSLNTSPDQIVGDMQALRTAGCDSFLIFGGHAPYGTPGFPSSSLVDASGNATNLAAAVLQGSISATATTDLTLPGLNGYAVPCTGQPRPVVRRAEGTNGPSADWTGIPDSGTIGHTVLGKPIKVYIREACDKTNVKNIVIVSSIHASENGGQFVSHELLYNTQLPANIRIIAIPELNGDSIIARIRQNANGVDLNRNNDYLWTSLLSHDDITPGAFSYRGTAPASEPETQAIESFLLSLGKVSLSLHYHDNKAYVGASANTPTSLAATYSAVSGLKLGNYDRIQNPGGGVSIYQKGSLDAWSNTKIGTPAILVELSDDQSPATINKNVEAVKAVITGGGI